MKGIFIIMVLFIVVPSVSAVGILVPEELLDDDFLSVRAGQIYDLDFQLRGDDGAKDVKFFIRSDSPNNVKFNGKTEYEKSLFLDVYEQENVNVEINGSGDKNKIVVTYGFIYIDGGSNNGIGLEQVISNEFELRVRCTDCNINDVDEGLDVYVDLDDSSSKSSSGRGSGGGGSSNHPPFTDMNSSNAEDASIPSENDDDDDDDDEGIVLSAIDSGTTALTEAKVPLGFTTTQSQNAGVALNTGGKTLLIAVIALLIVMLVLNSATIMVVRNE